jgi:MoxR-like ATPase
MAPSPIQPSAPAVAMDNESTGHVSGTGDMSAVGRTVDAIVANVERVVRGKSEAVRLAVIGLLAEGHLLIEDVPGVGKTSLAKALAASVECSWQRVQFTPDLLPGDLTGLSVWRRSDDTFEFRPGPLFANIVLADEINRASPKTQSALLEAMEERQISVDGTTHRLPAPFFVIATQNPVEQEGTYRLPESQLDRFLLRISLGYPDRSAEIEILDRSDDITEVELPAVIDTSDVARIIRLVKRVHLAPALRGYIVDLAEASRRHPGLRLGMSPRASVQLARTVRAHAAAAGRDYATPDDVKAVAVAVLAHRFVTRPGATGAPRSAEACVEDLLGSVNVPLGG